MNNELVILAFLTSWCVTSILSKIILLMPSPVMQIGAAFAAKMCAKEGAFGYGTPIVGRTEL